jgi:hypothetical protein
VCISSILEVVTLTSWFSCVVIADLTKTGESVHDLIGKTVERLVCEQDESARSCSIALPYAYHLHLRIGLAMTGYNGILQMTVFYFNIAILYVNIKQCARSYEQDPLVYLFRFH